MTYEEWLAIIEKLKSRNINRELLNQITNNQPPTIDRALPKVLEMIDCRFDLSVKNMINNLEEMFSDENMLDMYMVNFKKEILFLNDLCHLPMLPSDTKRTYMIKLKTESDRVYDIIEKEADNEDYTGYLRQLIKYNRIKWSE